MKGRTLLVGVGPQHQQLVVNMKKLGEKYEMIYHSILGPRLLDLEVKMVSSVTVLEIREYLPSSHLFPKIGFRPIPAGNS